MKTTLTIALFAAAGTAASAQLSAERSSITNPEPRVAEPSNPTAGTMGDPFGLSVFATADDGSGAGSGGLIGIANGITSVGGSDTFADQSGGFAPDVNVSSTLTMNGAQGTLTIDASTVDGSSFLQGGLAINGFAVNGFGFDIGDIFNSPAFPDPTDPINFDPALVSIDFQQAEFFIDGSSILPVGLDGALDTDVDGNITSYADQILVTVGAGGDLFGGNPIDQVVATIEFTVVPTPASAALLGLGGLAAARRRR